MAEPREFICIDCKSTVFQFVFHAANDVDVCAQCQWLRDVEDPEEREKLRKFLEEKP